MSPDRWRSLSELFDAAIDLPEPSRSAYLDQACPDPALRAEVESLIRADAGSSQALQSAAQRAAADYIVDLETASLSPGQSFGSYEIVRSLGRGGMGEIYLAHDARLSRSVALKILAGEFTADPNRLSRFRKEARLVSALSHPNILAVYETGEWEGRKFIAAEFVEGRTLREELAAGPIPAARAIEIAAQAAAAFSAAHQAGIIHRDIKPENIMVRPDGHVKVLDFGLAKLAEPLPTDTVVTLPGVVAGTAGYMSPEQTRGLALDPRTDIFSLGAVLYEMLSGSPPFEAATPADTLARVLSHNPPPLSPEFDRIIARALAKDLAARYPSMAEFLADLQALKPESVARSSRRTFVALAAAGAGVAAAAVIVPRLLPLRVPVSADAARLTLIPTDAETTAGVVSPDGRHITTVRESAGLASLWVRQRAGNSREVQIAPPSPSAYSGLAYSPDSGFLYCAVAGVLYRQPALGGDRQPIAERVDSVASINPSGRGVVFRRSPVRGNLTGLILVEDSSEHVLATSAEPQAFQTFYWTPDGKAVHYLRGSSGAGDWSLVELIPGERGGRTLLTNLPGPISFAYMPDVSGIFAIAPSAGGVSQICFLSLPSGRRYAITHDAFEYSAQSITADGKVILAARRSPFALVQITKFR